MITNADAKVLDVLTDDGANPYELASAARLTASEVSDALERLQGDKLVKVESIRKTPRVTLTDQGKRLRRSLSGSVRSPGARVLASDPQEVYANASEADLDAALDAVTEGVPAAVKQ